MTPFDRFQAARGFTYGAVAACATAAIMLTTDEPYSSVGTRLARMAALAPLLGVVAVLAASEHARVNGEGSALAALGVPAWRVASGAVLAAWAIAAVGAAVLCLPLTNVSALFPAVSTSVVWEPHGTALVAPELGLRVNPDGSMVVLPVGAAEGLVQPGRGSALLFAVPAAIVAPPWAALTRTWTGRCIGVLSAAIVAVVVLHLVAAGQASSWALLSPTAVLAAHAALLTRWPERL